MLAWREHDTDEAWRYHEGMLLAPVDHHVPVRMIANLHHQQGRSGCSHLRAHRIGCDCFALDSSRRRRVRPWVGSGSSVEVGVICIVFGPICDEATLRGLAARDPFLIAD